jgi:predicted nucleotidyltransferase
MEKRSIETIVRALNEANVRYLIVGGVAVVAYGYLRYTADLDLILDLREDNLRRASDVWRALGYRPVVPVSVDQFISDEIRAQWVREKGLTVFSLFSPDHARTNVDLFVEAPLDFDQAYAAAVRMEVAPGLQAAFVSLPDLILLKQQAGRSKDLEDIRQLTSLRKESKDD